MTEMRAVVDVIFQVSKKVTIVYDDEDYEDAQNWIDYSEESIPELEKLNEPFALLRDSDFEVDLWDTQIDSVEVVDGKKWAACRDEVSTRIDAAVKEHEKDHPRCNYDIREEDVNNE